MIIELLDGTRYDIHDYSLKRLFHHIPSPEINHNTSTVEGKADITVSSQLNGRIISVEFLYRTKDIYDYYLLRDQINALFTHEEAFYLIFKREPYKRYKVKLASAFEVPPHPHMASFTVEFVMQGKYAESVATTADLKEWDINKWGWNNVIDWDIERKYIFNENSFTIYNLGNAPIDPRENELKITARVTTETENFFRLINISTGEMYDFYEDLTANDLLEINGIRSFKNGVSVFRNTNKKVITLAPGANNFLVHGSNVSEIRFDFRFLFK